MPDAPLIDYASEASTRAGQTPVGIVLFAASHLMMGTVLMFVAWTVFQHMPPPANRAALEVFVPPLIVLGALPMLAGAVGLLLKGSFWWRASVVSFALLVLAECAAVAHAAGMSARYRDRQNTDATWALIYLFFAAAMVILGIIVLGYLRGEKARRTYNLPPGEPNAIVRSLPRAMWICFALAMVLGPMLRGISTLFPD